MSRWLLVLSLIVLPTSAILPIKSYAAEKLTWVQSPQLSVDPKTKQRIVTFELSANTDVEVALIDRGSGRIVRHLAAGVLGPNAPPPLRSYSLSQRLEWDGCDDYRTVVAKPTEIAVRVRAGMGVRLEQIVGGDPYAFYSQEMGHNDHSPFGINGLEAKADGKVYVLGHSSNLGPPVIREYDADGGYLRTVFPPPAGKDPKTLAGWGLNLKPDGTYAVKFNRLTDPSLSTTFLDTPTNGMARLFPTPVATKLQFWNTTLGVGGFDLLTINTDSTISANAGERLPGALVKSPPLNIGPLERNSHINRSLLGPVFSCFTPDGRFFYLSGVYAANNKYGSIIEVLADSPWRDGQVWKVDAATKSAEVVFSLDHKKIPWLLKDRRQILGGTHSYAALHGIAVDGEGRVFVADRLNKRIAVLDAKHQLIHEIPIEFPDSLAISHRTGMLYVTTRFGDEHSGRGEIKLLKFANWRKDDQPTSIIPLCPTGYTDHHKCSYVALCESENATNVWVASTEMPVRIYRDNGETLTLQKDFYRVENAQRCLGFDRIDVDSQTEEVYLLDDHQSVWKISNWKNPLLVRTPLRTASLAIDARQRHVYIRTLADGSSSNSVGKIARFNLDADYSPAHFGATETNRITPAMKYEWCFTGNGDKGLAVAANGNLAVVGDPQDGLRLFAGTADKLPWDATVLTKLPHAAGGVQFDFAGNCYVGMQDQKPAKPPVGFETDRFANSLGRIYKYAPTGNGASGNLFPTPPTSPAFVYEVPYGAFDTDCITRTPRFSVDGFGRIVYPTNIVPRVAICDNAGNEILQLGTYGNRDSRGGLPGDLIPTKEIPLAFPNSVATTDDFIYIGDMVNLQLLRVRKTFQLVDTN